MKKVCIFLGAMTISGCAGLSLQAPSLRTVYELRASYDAVFLVPATNYRRLGMCAVGQKTSFKAPCADPMIVRKLQLVDHEVQSALDNVENFTRAHPGDLRIQGLYDLAIATINQAETLSSDLALK